MSIPSDDLPDPNEAPLPDTPASQRWTEVDDATQHAACVAAFYGTLAAADVPPDCAAELTLSWMLAIMGVLPQ